MIWGLEPYFVRLFVFSLIGVGCATIVRLARLVWSLFRLFKRGRLSIQGICNGEFSANLLAKSALAGDLPRIAESKVGPQCETRSPLESSVERVISLAE